MPRAQLPGRWNRHRRAIPDPQASELDNVVALRPDLPPVQITLTGGRVPRMRRLRLAWAEFVAFICAPRFRP